jgi:hypothetical protein
MNVNERVRIKQASWDAYAKANGAGQNPGTQTVVEVGTHPPFEGLYQLTFPLHWWGRDDLEPA